MLIRDHFQNYKFIILNMRLTDEEKEIIRHDSKLFLYLMGTIGTIGLILLFWL